MRKKYSINWENDEVVSVEVNGVQYDSPDQIPDPDDRAKIELLMSDSPDVDLSLPASPPGLFSKIILAIFLAVAVLMLAISVISAINTGRTLSKEKSAPGNVIDLVARRDQAGKEFYYPVVEFYLPDGSFKLVQISEGSWPPAYEKGQSVTVLYDPEQPLNARIKSASSTALMWILSIITGALGVAFLIATLFVFWMLKPHPAKSQEE